MQDKKPRRNWQLSRYNIKFKEWTSLNRNRVASTRDPKAGLGLTNHVRLNTWRNTRAFPENDDDDTRTTYLLFRSLCQKTSVRSWSNGKLILYLSEEHSKNYFSKNSNHSASKDDPKTEKNPQCTLERAAGQRLSLLHAECRVWEQDCIIDFKNPFLKSCALKLI